MAIINGHFDLAKDLIDRGADPNAVSLQGVSPLYAVLNVEWAPKALYPQPQAHKQQKLSYLDLMTLLIEKGADVTAVSRRGQTTADMANGPVQRISPLFLFLNVAISAGTACLAPGPISPNARAAALRVLSALSVRSGIKAGTASLDSGPILPRIMAAVCRSGCDLLLTISISAGTGCGSFGGTLSAAWEEHEGTLVLVKEPRSEELSPTSAGDVDGDNLSALAELFGSADLLATPTTPNPPHPHSGPGEVMSVGFTWLFNLTGHPALSLPAGLTPDGLPVGLHLVAPHHADALLLAAARSAEQSIPPLPENPLRGGAPAPEL